MSRDPSTPPRVGSPIPQPLGSAEVLRCPSCRLLLWEPVTVSCGHSFCKPCLGGAVPSRCPVCHRRLKLLGVEEVRCNVVLCNLLEKYEERGSCSARLAARIRSRLARGDLQDALRMAQKGIEMGKQRGARGADKMMTQEGLYRDEDVLLEQVGTSAGHFVPASCVTSVLTQLGLGSWGAH